MAVEGVGNQKSEVKGQKSEFRIQSLSNVLADFLTQCFSFGIQTQITKSAFSI